MAETRPTAGTLSVKATSVQPKKSSNAISWLAPIICIVAGYCIWRFILGDRKCISINRIIAVVSGPSMKDQKMHCTVFIRWNYCTSIDWYVADGNYFLY